MKLIKQGSNIYYLRPATHQTKIEIFVTDLEILWSDIMEKDDAVDRFTSQNPLIRAAPDWKLSQVEQLLNSPEASLVLSHTEAGLSLDSTLCSSDIKVHMNFVLSRRGTEQFSREVVNPLVGTINLLVEQRSELLALVKSKDLELGEFKLNGANISRKNVETEEFDENEFLSKSRSNFIVKHRDLPTVMLTLPPDLA